MFNYVLLGFLAGWVLCGVVIWFLKPFGETENEKNARDNERFIAGYKLGYKAGRNEALIKNFTPDEFRAIIGLPHIKGEKKDAVGISRDGAGNQGKE